MRYVIARKGQYKIKQNVNLYLKNEKKENTLNSIKGCLKFKKKM